MSVSNFLSCPVLLSAIRQGEDHQELLVRTVLKLRVDQKGNGVKGFNVENAK